ncbi:MAG TPA: autotransporter domain-containing protein [Rhizomicrobium sp.]|jgi:uncharacterized protein with beta-barrel porin domain|nr:autotransporter domain-containing protein [Rhizomicrobium sp.]
MTNSNSRHLARVRNAFLGATALAGFSALITPAAAVVINNNFTPTQIVDTTNVTGVGQMVVDEQNGFIGLCTVSLINPRTVIFASHCVNENPSETAFMSATGYGVANGGLPIGFFFQSNNNIAGNSAIGSWLNGVAGVGKDTTRTAQFGYNSNFVVYNTNCCTIGLGNNFLQSDVAMAALDTPAVNIPTYTLLFSALSAPAHATIEGYGDNGTGTTGQGTIDFKRRVAENIVSVLGSLDDQDTFLFGAPDGLPANLYMIDFNDPKFNTAQANVFDFNIFHDTATTKEGITAPGDSGGPLVIDHQFSSPTIAAVLSGGDRFYNAQPGASYGTTSFYQPLYLYWDWILSNNPYKYVTSTAGNHSWTDPNAFVMALDPAYMTIGSNGQLVNALPTTPAAGEANIPPGFGEVCYFNDCINIKTGVHTNPTPAPGPNPTNNSQPFGGVLGQTGFDTLVEAFIAAGGQDCGAAQVSVDALNTGDMSAIQPACSPDAATGTPGASDAAHSAQTNWANPEGSVAVNGVMIQGAPGATPGQVVQDTNQNVATLNPARYYDVTIAAGGITLNTGTITVDRVTVNSLTAGLTIATGATLNTLINTNSFAGELRVNGTLNSTGSVSMFGGLISGTGTVNAPSVDFLLGAIAPGTNGTIGTLTINGTLNLGAGATTAIDVSGATSDLLKVNGVANVAGTAVIVPQTTVQMGTAYTFLTATTINGASTANGGFNAVTDTLPGVLFPVVTKVNNGATQSEVVTFQAGSFVTVLNGSGTPDQIAVAGGLDRARGAHYNDMLPLFQAIDPLSGGQLGQALEDLAPDAARTAPLVGHMQTSGIDDMLWQHLGDMTPASGGGQQAGLHVDSDGLKSAMNSATGFSNTAQQFLAIGQGIATNPGGGNDAVPTTGTPAAPAQADGTWMSLPNGAGGFISGSAILGSVAIGGGGGKADVRGLIVGAGLDMPVGDGFSVGGSFAYSDVLSSGTTIPETLQSDMVQGAVYARYDFGDHMIAEAFAGYGHQTLETTHLELVGPTLFSVVGHTDGDSPSAGIYLGRSFGISTLYGSTLNLIPSLSLQYINSSINGYTETGGPSAVHISSFSESSAMSRFGIDANMTFDVYNVHVTPNLHAFWVDNFEGGNGAIQAQFAAAPGSIMVFQSGAVDRSYGELGLGADVDLSDAFGSDATFSARYDTNSRADINYGAWTGRLSIKF